MTQLVKNGDSVGIIGAQAAVKPVHCDGCGKCMTDPVSGETIVGVRLQWHPSAKLSEEFLKQQFGRFEKPVYSFCFECWIGSLMGGK